ncbi:MAG: hypothetical protein WCK58_19150, partial [Chloroflexota bacterium]
MSARRLTPAQSLVLAIVLAACGGPAASGAPSSAPGTPRPSEVAAASATPGASAGPLQPDDPALGTPPPTTVLPDSETGDIPAEETTPVLAGSLATGAPGAPETTTVAGETKIRAGALSVTLAAGALADGTAVQVSASTVDGIGGEGWGGAITPVSDLYTIAGAEALASPATVGIAIRDGTPADATHIPMLAYYDAATGSISPLTPLAPDPANPDVVRGLATHFS